jgi:hypothetical protein
LRQPAVTDRDVFFSATRAGLYRLQRESGRELWRNRDVSRFLAVNYREPTEEEKKAPRDTIRFVYAMGRAGQFHVLDGLRGTSLAEYDLRDWTLPVLNEWTDRVYLASNDGQIICLRHRDQLTPVFNKTVVVPRLEEEKMDAAKDMPKELMPEKAEKKADNQKAADPKEKEEKKMDNQKTADPNEKGEKKMDNQKAADPKEKGEKKTDNQKAGDKVGVLDRRWPQLRHVELTLGPAVAMERRRGAAR